MGVRGRGSGAESGLRGGARRGGSTAPILNPGSIVVAVPAAGFLVPLSILLLTQAMSVSSADRTYKVKVRGAVGSQLAPPGPPRFPRFLHCPWPGSPTPTPDGASLGPSRPSS